MKFVKMPEVSNPSSIKVQVKQFLLSVIEKNAVKKN
jgi:hypothetical protein